MSSSVPNWRAGAEGMLDSPGAVKRNAPIQFSGQADGWSRRRATVTAAHGRGPAAGGRSC